MDAPYKYERRKQNRLSVVAGITLSAAINLSIVAFGAVSGLKYIYPPPEEKSILIDFSEQEKETPVQKRDGTQPRAVNADPGKDIRLVQASQAQHEGTKTNEAPEATVGPDGDVEVPEPPREKEINRKALFHAANNKTEKDTLAPQTASKVSDALKPGHAQGNTNVGRTDGEPNAKVKGRHTVGVIPKPKYTVQKEGIVVVSIKVNSKGEVIDAKAGDIGTTVTDQTLWKEAEKAAYQTYFNTVDDNQRPQVGTITYIFKLR